MTDLPTGWTWAELGELGEWYGGATPSKRKPGFWQDGTVPWLSPKDMGPDTLAKTQDKIATRALDESPVRLVPEGSVAVVVRSGILARTIPVAFVPFATALNQDMKAVVAYTGIDARWVAWGLRTFERQVLQEARKSGTTVASLEVSRLMQFKLPVPPSTEQQRILAALENHLFKVEQGTRSISRVTQVERFGDSRKRKGLVVDLLQSIRCSRVWPTGMDQLPSGWSWGSLGDVLEDIEAGKSFRCEARPAAVDEWGVIKVSAMTWGEFRGHENKALPSTRIPDEKYEIHTGDILVSRANTEDYVGAPVLVGSCRPRLLLSDKSLRLKPLPGVDRGWLIHALASPLVRSEISARATGTKDSMRNISQKSLRAIRIPIPPTQDQRAIAAEIAEVVAKANELERISRDLLEHADILRIEIMNSAFSGRLVPQDPVDEPASVMLERIRAARAAVKRRRRSTPDARGEINL